MKRFNISLLAFICPALVFLTSVYCDNVQRRKAWYDIVAICKTQYDDFLYEDTSHMATFLGDVKDWTKKIDAEKADEVEKVIKGFQSIETAQKTYTVVKQNKAAVEKNSDDATTKIYEASRALYHIKNETAFTELIEAQEKIFEILRSIPSKQTAVETMLDASLALQKLKRYDASLTMMKTLLPLNRDSLRELNEMYNAKSEELDGRMSALEEGYKTIAKEHSEGSDNLRGLNEKLVEMTEIEKEMNKLNCLLIQQSRLVGKKYRDVDGKNADAAVRGVINLISGRAVAGNRSEYVQSICEVALSNSILQDRMLLILVAGMGSFVTVVIIILGIVLAYKRSHRQL